MANLDPRGLIGNIYIGDHYRLLHTKYISSGLMVSEMKIFKLSNFKSMGANDPRSMASLDPRGLIGRIYVGDTKYCYILNM